MKNILFYKYVELEDVEKLRIQLNGKAKAHNLLGTILIAEEGINGCLSGDDSNVEAFLKDFCADSRFSDIEFKEGFADAHTFKRLSVRIRPEIVTSRLDVDIKNRAEYIEPKELKKLLDSDEEVVMLDVRNRYEHKIGHFKDAVELQMDVHREFPEAVKKVSNLKNKKIVTYCTGGVRCEKASAYLKEQGFTDVKQLHGGIIKYGSEVGNDHWEGKCLVFDTRGAIDIDPDNQSEPISQCVLCNLPTSDYHNCALVSCDDRFLACDNCFDTLHGCCSKECRGKLPN